MKKGKLFLAGVKTAMPVCVGYFSVSFGFGALAVSEGIRVLDAVLISAVNLTSAGQFAGVTVIAAAATLLEMFLTQLVINSRYALMSLALGQRLGESMGTWGRMLIAFFNTDEIFALAMGQREKPTLSFMLGMGCISFAGWVGGTLLGALAGSILPLSIRMALGVLLYGMFVAILVPQAEAEKPKLAAMLLAVLCSSLFWWIPGLNQVSQGLAIVISTVIAACICAVLFPVKDEEEV